MRRKIYAFFAALLDMRNISTPASSLCCEFVRFVVVLPAKNVLNVAIVRVIHEDRTAAINFEFQDRLLVRRMHRYLLETNGTEKENYS